MSLQRRNSRLRSARATRRRRVELDAPGSPSPARADQKDTRYPDGGPAIRIRGAGAEAGRPPTVTPESVSQTVMGTGTRTSARPGAASSVRLEGRTDADFNGGSFRTVGGITRPATGCEGCGAEACQRATGRLVIRFAVRTTVNLPTIDPSLTACQRRRVRDGIRNILAPHEQEHVRAFRTYEGTVTKPFDLTLCHDDFDAAIRTMVEGEEVPRRAAAQALSDALDQPPFFFNVDLDCQEPPRQGGRPRGQAAADTTPEAERPA